MKPSSYFSIITLIVIACMLAGCGGIKTGYAYRGVRQEDRIDLLSQSEVKGIWSGKDITVAYRYSLAKATLEIEGAITLSSHLNNYSTMDRLHLYLHFVDADGRTAGQSIVYNAPHRREISMLDLNFNRSIAVPPEIKAIAFTYSGLVSDGMGSDDGAISWSFWNAL